MTPRAHGDAGLPDSKELAQSRVRFLTAEPAESSRVRMQILASWRRSRDLQVAADQIKLPYVHDLNRETPLARSAEPVLRNLREQLDGQPVSIILTDQTGLVLSRLTADSDLERHLDGVRLAPGFSYAEQFVGTNGIGTALEVGGPTHVFGHEHYAEHLEDLACAGVPIHHPVTGRTVGAVDLTCWRKDAGSLLLTLAKTTAGQIQQAMLAETGEHPMALFREYLRTCRRMTGIVFAMNRDVVMLNDYARTVLDPADQSALLGRAGEMFSTEHRGTVGLVLPTGVPARMYCNLVGSSGSLAGVVVHVKLDAAGPEQGGPHAPVTRMPLPGVVGLAPLWLRACHEVEAVFQSREWPAVSGEPGVGKLALLRAVQLRRQPVGRFVILDADDTVTNPQWTATVRRTLLEDADSVAIRHVDRLDGPRLRALSSALQEVHDPSRHRPLWVAITFGPGQPGKELGDLMRLFPRTVEVPPLRLHLEDLQQLVSFFLSRLGHGGQLVCSPKAMQLLMRSSWPGNAEQVHQTLRQVVQHRRAGSIEPGDLPPETQSVSRRMLTPLESMERDAIVRSLGDTGGNKAAAAQSLGMSRATIYRKIHEYGIGVRTT